MKKNKMTSPLVSVIIPTRNRCNYVAEAIDSVLQQTLQDFELIVIDDASNDGTAALLDTYATQDKRIQVVRSPRNLGCNKARNIGLSRARGCYIAFLDDDDRALPERLARTVAKLAEVPNVGIVSTGYRFIDAHGHAQPWPPPPPAFDEPLITGDVAFEQLYCKWAWLPTSTLTMKAELFTRYQYPEIHRSDGDSILVTQLATSGTNFLVLSDYLAYIRRDKSYTYMSRDWGKVLAARRQSLRYLSQWLRRQGITKFDHLHKLAWCNHLLKEAEFYGNLRGLMLASRALVYQPYSRQAHAYFRLRMGRGLRALLHPFSPSKT